MRRKAIILLSVALVAVTIAGCGAQKDGQVLAAETVMQQETQEK